MLQASDEVINQASFDDPKVMAMALYMALLGYAVLVGIPVISTAWVEQLGYSEIQVGRLAGADLGGLSIGSIFASLFIQRLDRRLITLLGIGTAIFGNAMCLAYAEYETVLLLRGVAGIGSGIYTSIAIAMLGATSRPARSFNILLFAFAFTQAGEMQLLPQLSMNQIYTLFISLYCLSIPFLKWIPKHGIAPSLKVIQKVANKKPLGVKKQVSDYIPWLVLSAIFLSYVCIGAYWTYVELANIDAGLDRGYISQVLVWASFMSIVGCLFATLISNRFGMARPLLLALILMACAVLLMLGKTSNIELFISLLAFNFLWIFIDVYQMGSMSVFDSSGRYVSLMPAAQGLGQIVGPVLASIVLENNYGYDGVFLMCSMASVAAMLIYALTYFRLKKYQPELADAS